MSPATAVDLIRDGMSLIVLMALVIIGPGLIVGLIVSVFQAATQINEQTLSFLPRLIVTLLVIMVMGPWMLDRLLDHFNGILMDIPGLIG
ncbi:flagellar biosynthesis protein FliQ [Hydrocarboniclastica marina]|uniref:Flagellar biosynthetic protein FliQ n=1 Tax=Hydrocarboniclastica marina TaxID=2259620 RepID=A0A4P7XGV8_9ALTE|nr:flagellar biosynthesis protein FliQ [Hydrocarboniclastica marina]MAL98567.1 flagellar biosynthetic protein FliQ [Alteromonadaceae bacterium]QCF25684.1 flagellar biosynthetic protein FliQ [Hydrocarboniclastica marina]|tara:strand:+ start:4939 stop:5208 length:270 start_codon:yes stop_codon:yes gene_type:complete